MTVKDAVLGALGTATVSALATGAFQPVSEVAYGLSDKLVNAYVPKSWRKPLPNSAKSLQLAKFDPSNTPKSRAKFERDKDEESWNLIKKDLDKLPTEDILKYDEDLIDRKYQSKFREYQDQRRHKIFGKDNSIDNMYAEYQDLSEDKDPEEEQTKKRRKLRKVLAVGIPATAGLGVLGANLVNNTTHGVTEVIPPFERIVRAAGLANSMSFSESNPTPEEKKANRKRKLKKLAKSAALLGGAAAITKGSFGVGRVTGNIEGYFKGLEHGHRSGFDSGIKQGVSDTLDNVKKKANEWNMNHILRKPIQFTYDFKNPSNGDYGFFSEKNDFSYPPTDAECESWMNWLRQLHDQRDAQRAEGIDPEIPEEDEDFEKSESRIHRLKKIK